jgi:hypothetical protein
LLLSLDWQAERAASASLTIFRSLASSLEQEVDELDEEIKDRVNLTGREH